MIKGDLSIRYRNLESNQQIILLFLVDSSESMIKDKQIAFVKGLVEHTLEKFKYKKIKYGLVALINSSATTLCALTSNSDELITQLKKMPAGGKTNMKEGFHHIHKLIKTDGKNLHKHILYILTDGKINYGTSNPFKDAVSFYKTTLKSIKETSVVNTEKGLIRLAMAKILAEEIKAKYIEMNSDE